jgi:probable F420-dependent oxidoreductase
MLVDAMLKGSIDQTRSGAAALEAEGYDGIWVGETSHDPFLQVVQASDSTQRVALGTSIAVAFARSPMTLAHTAFDLARYTRGRFALGIGSQVKAHIERRFSMPWSEPARRMREYVLALRAIWAAWQDRQKLDFRGDFYAHTLMTPFFSPEPHAWGAPPVLLAAVGPLMTEVAGEVCDGCFLHPLTTERYVDEETLPALERGRARAGKRGLEGYAVAAMPFACVGRDDAELAEAIRGTRQQIAFYASTPAYRPVLDLQGQGALQPELTRLSREGRWQDMGAAIDDELLRAVAVVGGPEEVGRGLSTRWAARATRITLYAPYRSDPAIWPRVLQAIRG